MPRAGWRLLDGERHVLAEGDPIYFRADRTHHFDTPARSSASGTQPGR